MRQKIRLITLFFLMVFCAGMNASAAPPEWNVLLITVDTLRYDRISFHTDKYVHTPNMDWLARKSQVFSHAYSHAPVTLPSHISIFTGTTPLYHGISDNPGYRLGDRFYTIAEYFKDKGYATGAFVGAIPVDSRYGLNQ